MANLTERAGNRAWVDVDLGAVVANARAVQEAAGGVPLLPMIKADAYGLGAVPVAEALERVGPWGFGVATGDEAVSLRGAGVRRPVLVFTPATVDQLGLFRQHNLRAVVDRADVARVWTEPFHLEIDTGMGRCGVRWDDVDEITACVTPHLEGAFTHFYAADVGRASVQQQWRRFEAALEAMNTYPRFVHAANSAGAWRLDERLSLLRPGIFLYGGSAGRDLPAPQPAIQLRAPVVSLRRVREGDTVSYGGTWMAPRDTTIATLGVGYADGVPRAIQGRAQVLLHGERRPVVGRVTMDFIMVALQDGDAVEVGSVATLIGADGTDAISLDEFAAWADTISYEVLARLGPRLPRRYHGP